MIRARNGELLELNREMLAVLETIDDCLIADRNRRPVFYVRRGPDFDAACETLKMIIKTARSKMGEP